MRSPHFGVKSRAPTCCVKFSTDTQCLGVICTLRENPGSAETGKSASEHGSAEKCDSLRMSLSSAYGHGATLLFIDGYFPTSRIC